MQGRVCRYSGVPHLDKIIKTKTALQGVQKICLERPPLFPAEPVSEKKNRGSRTKRADSQNMFYPKTKVVVLLKSKNESKLIYTDFVVLLHSVLLMGIVCIIPNLNGAYGI